MFAVAESHGRWLQPQALVSVYLIARRPLNLVSKAERTKARRMRSEIWQIQFALVVI